jgi:hypothetical protein
MAAANPKRTTIGPLIDALYAARAMRIEKQRDIDAMKSHERTLHQQIMEALEAQGLQKGSGKTATASITVSTVPKVEDWNKLYAYILKTKSFELLHRRIASTAWTDIVDAGKQVPGVSAMEVTDLSLTKSGA